MFGAEKLKQMVSKTAPAESKGGNSSSLLTVIVLVIAIGTLVICWLTFQVVQSVDRGQSMEREVRAGAEGVANSVASQIHTYRQILNSLSQDKQLISLFVDNDLAELRKKGSELLLHLPGARQVRLLPAGWNEKETGVGPKLSFASLSMLRDVEKSRAVSVAEVHQFKTKQQHIAMAAPVIDTNTGNVVGVIHLSLPMAIISRAVSLAGSEAGQVYVQQVVDGRSLTIVSSGNASGGIDSSTDSIEVPGSIWSVAYKVGGITVGWLDGILLFGIMGVGLGLMVLVVSIFTRRYQFSLANDQQQILRLVDKLLHGKTITRYHAKVPELQETMDQLALLKPATLEQARPQKAIKGSTCQDTGLPKVGVKEERAAPSVPKVNNNLPQVILRNYDIRGVVGKDLTTDVVYQLGRAIGSMAYDEGEQTVIVARDGRKSGQELSTALYRGLMDSGRDVVDIGMVPTPLLYFATHFLGSNSGVMLTGSHNPPDYNGLKMVVAGETLSGEKIKNLGQRVANGDLLQGEGMRTEQDLVRDYINRVAEDLHIARPLKVVLDCGNGVGSVVAPALLKLMGCKVAELYCDVDGEFPNHHPDPSKPENLAALINAVKSSKADIGLALDGDGDRIGVVDSEGNIIWPDRLLMLLAADLLTRHPGADIIYDVKCSRHLSAQILTNGGRPLMWKSGHSLIKAKMRETGALLAGEMSGHIFFKERWYGFDDGIYACARLLEILAADSRSSAEVFAELPDSISTPELSMSTAEGENVALVEKFIANGNMPGAKMINIDGVRAEFQHGWGLMRASNTMPAVIFRFEADDINGLEHVKDLFRQELLKIDPELKLPF